MKTFFYSFYIFLIFILLGCVKNNPNPSWLEIKEFTVVTNPLLNNNEGDLSRNALSNAWVYIDDKFIGIFELPCKIPVLKFGSANVRVYPTILNNGISATKKMYPFMEAYEKQVTLIGDEVTTINPTTRYDQYTKFWVEDFESSTVKLHDGTDTKTSVLVESENGNNYGKVTLTQSENKWSCYMSFDPSDQTPFTFTPGNQVYLEFECKNQNPVKTQIIWATNNGSTESNIYYGASTFTDGWKKICIDFSEYVNTSGGVSFYFGFVSDLPSDASTSTILIDNIKLVYR